MDEETKNEIDFLERRIAWLEGIVSDMKDADNAEEHHDEGMRLNWIVIALFAIELVIGGFQLWWALHHG